MTKKIMLIIVIGTAVVYGLARIFMPIGVVTKELNLIGPFVLLLTLIAVVWYSWETSQLRIQQKDIMELSLKPHLISIFRLGDFYLCNIGNGPAVNIRIDDVMVTLHKLPTVRLMFSCPYVLKKDESKPIKIKILTEDGSREAPDFHLGWLLLPAATETVDVNIYFENLMGKGYEYKSSIGKGMPSEVDPIDLLLRLLEGDTHPIFLGQELDFVYGDHQKLLGILKYCRDKGFIEAEPIETDQEGIVDFKDIIITAKGIDYLKGKG